jgi:hypothetical protein
MHMASLGLDLVMLRVRARGYCYLLTSSVVVKASAFIPILSFFSIPVVSFLSGFCVQVLFKLVTITDKH